MGKGWLCCFGLLWLSISLTLTAPFSFGSGGVGILVMAHGGSAEWNRAIEQAVAPLGSACPIRIAFGMAERDSLQAAVKQLEMQGASRIAVVGLFVSEQSFRHQAEYFLGLRSEPPAHFIDAFQHPAMVASTRVGSRGEPHQGKPRPIERKAALILNRQGLYDSPRMGEILLERVRAQSISSRSESVLILAHGAGDEAENARWLSKLNELANRIRQWKPFRAVRVETLREDWKNERREAEKRIRDFVIEGNRHGGRVVIVPFRVFGFGPYHDVLKGLRYVADGVGLLPHAEVTEWVKEQSADCFSRAGWLHPFLP